MRESKTKRSVAYEGEVASAVTQPAAAVQIKIGSRLGVWGLVGGLGTMTAGALGAPISLATAIAVMGGGVLVSGLGTLLASTGALRATGRLPRFIRGAAVAGLPLGAVLSLLGITTLAQWEPLIAVVNVLTAAAGILGALVVILLVIGFFVDLPSKDDGTLAAEQEGGAL